MTVLLVAATICATPDVHCSNHCVHTQPLHIDLQALTTAACCGGPASGRAACSDPKLRPPNNRNAAPAPTGQKGEAAHGSARNARQWQVPRAVMPLIHSDKRGIRLNLPQAKPVLQTADGHERMSDQCKLQKIYKPSEVDACSQPCLPLNAAWRRTRQPHRRMSSSSSRRRGCGGSRCWCSCAGCIAT
jgi:hypothetical protein